MTALLPECMIPDDDKRCTAFAILQDHAEKLVQENMELRKALREIVDSDGRFDTVLEIAKNALSPTDAAK